MAARKSTLVSEGVGGGVGSSSLGVKNLTQSDLLMKLAIGSTRPAEVIARQLGASPGSPEERYLVRLVERIREQG